MSVVDYINTFAQYVADFVAMIKEFFAKFSAGEEEAGE